jgi:CopG family transcriptional regulator, nickel-responsive regulator
MERITISVSDAFSAEIADFMASRGYDNRSEALRDLARLGLEQTRIDAKISGDCLATLSYVFDHHSRELPKRLTEAHHARHDLHVATMHVHLDHNSCLEVAVLKGKARAVREFSDAVIAERGVRHGHVNFIPVTVARHAHGHGAASGASAHTHIHPTD